MDAGKQKQKDTFATSSPTEGLRKDNEVTSKTSEQEALVRRLRRENHLLRLQLLRLREQQRRNLHLVAAASALCNSDDEQLSAVGNAGVPPHSSTSPVVDVGGVETTPRSAAFNDDDEAAAVRARTLQRQEERQQRTTCARALLLSAEQLCTELVHAEQQQKEAQESGAASHVETASPDTSIFVTASPTVAAPSDLSVLAVSVANTPLNLSVGPFRDCKSINEDDLSAQTMLQRFHSRKAQRRLRLEQMLGPGHEGSAADDVSAETTSFGKVPRCLTGAHEGGAVPHTNSCNSRRASVDAWGLENEPLLGETASATDGGANLCHRAARAGGPAGNASPFPTRPTQNPNQIGRAVTDAVKNNSWYLCKVLEAALLGTIQPRNAYDDSTTPAQTLTHPSPATRSGSVSTPNSAHDGKGEETTGVSVAMATTALLADSCAEAGQGSGGTTAPQSLRSPQPSAVTPTSAVAPQFLYQEGVSGTALRRAIEESLVLHYRCIHNAPQRLTSQQAADEAVPPFEAENSDSELRRCFAGNTTWDAAECSNSPAAGGDDSGNRDSPALGADDQALDPFARLLLARISSELPSGSAKGEKKHKGHRDSSKQREDLRQAPFCISAEGGRPFGLAMGKGSQPSSPSTSKPNTAFVIAAAGPDGKARIPKRHFSRLDEVQVEMHAPVIFNQIRGFLRFDVDRFRRSFLQAGLYGEASTDGVSRGAAADGSRLRLTPQQQRQQLQQRVRGSAAARAGEATAWRISVSPGKSGTTLLYFGDCVMKTVRPSEMEFFTRKFLPAYVRYCERNPHTLLPRFYALITVRWWKAGIAQHFVLMHNVFATPYYIHRIYDVKGSTVNRTALQAGTPPPRTAFGALLLKDNDLPPQLIICGAYQRAILLAQFRSDVGFLRQLSVVDYSCLIGVRSRFFSREEGPSKTIVLQRHQHNKNDEPCIDPLSSGAASMPPARHQRMHSEITNVTSAAADAEAQTTSIDTTGAGQLASTPGRQPASEDDVYVCIHGCDGGLLSLPIYAPGDDTTAREDVYYLGIIDVLQTYNSAKKLESFAKGFVNDRQAISVIPPEGYAERLYKVLDRITA
ncbi:putative phosphatidylinositol-4-phosphate 5-kinase [Leptomonas seymouri]|uniref:Putative phosphatidylinositol-4-phosphate 5-kinase n=1 Tax=Leptomonas seymouri TaxID=5684 RepID=A0A0N1I1T7_LEPSE|nr:putative phosphatidylinositol-4-phosphate 5-kinase [Leptomonas seymouri]|eukprot:KPI83430.1 putative phosphatidylinositol-4-phosphate 5-kinase [Leptomonas seymouri]